MADDHDNDLDDFDDEEEFGIDQRRMPFTGHLVELRSRLIICIITVGAVFFLSFFFFRKPLYDLLTLPVRYACNSTDGKVPFEKLLRSNTPTSMFVTSAYMCILLAISVTVPLTGYQIWAFVAPGLKKRERRAVVPILTVGTILFLIGSLFSYLVVSPAALQFLMMDTVQFDGVTLLWDISATLKFVMILMLVFGIAFEMPLVIVALTKVGIVTPKALASKRRHAIVVMFIVGAALTPPDVVTQVLLAGPLIVLYEISIQASKFYKPKGSFWDRWDNDEDDDPPPPSPGPSSPDDSSPDSYLGDSQNDYGYSEDHYDGHDPYSDEYGYGDDSYGQSGYNPEEELSDGTGEEPAQQETVSDAAAEHDTAGGEPQPGGDTDTTENPDAEAEPAEDVPADEEPAKAVEDNAQTEPAEDTAADEETRKAGEDETDSESERLYEGYEPPDDDVDPQK